MNLMNKPHEFDIFFFLEERTAAQDQVKKDIHNEISEYLFWNNDNGSTISKLILVLAWFGIKKKCYLEHLAVLQSTPSHPCKQTQFSGLKWSIRAMIFYIIYSY